jgi:hypothetical protein
MSKGFFKYLEESTWQEKDAIANELKAMYNGILEDEQKCYAQTMRHEKSTKAKHNYFEAVQRLGTIQGIFETLHIDYECGKKFDIPEFHWAIG